MPNTRQAASQPAITSRPTTSGGAMSPSFFRTAWIVMGPTWSSSPDVSACGDLEVLHELRREALLPVGVGGKEAFLHHQLVGRLPARLGDDAHAHGLGVAAIGDLELVEALDAEGDLLVAHLRIVGLDQRIRGRRVALEVALPALDRGAHEAPRHVRPLG